MEAIVLAGGLGRRLRPEVKDVPKPMAPIGNRPFLEYLLDHWIEQGVDRIVLSVGYLAQLIQGHFGEAYRGVPIVYSVEKTQLGTGGGLRLAARQLKSDGPVLVLNGDTFFRIQLRDLRRFHEQSRSDLTLAMLRKESEGRYSSILLDEDGGKVQKFGVDRRVSPWINGGVYLFSQGIIESFRGGSSHLSCSLENQILPSLLFDGWGVFAFSSNALFIDIGVPEDYRRAANLLTEKLAG